MTKPLFSVLEKSKKRNSRLPVTGSLETIFGREAVALENDTVQYNKPLLDYSSLTQQHEDFTQDSSEAGYLRDLSVQISDQKTSAKNISLK